MKKSREHLDRVKKALQSSYKGMTITEISAALGANRNSVAKYLDMLYMAGEVEMKTFGRSKIFSISDIVPLDIALSLSSELIAIIDEEYRIIDVNNRFLQHAGVERVDIIGQTLETLRIDYLAQPEILLNVKDALRGREYSREITIERKNEKQYYKIWLKPLTTGGTKNKVAVVYQNITATKTAELALKESEARYRAIVEDQVEMICRFSADTTIIFVNKSFCNFFGMGSSQLVGRRLSEFLLPEEKSKLISGLNILCIDKTPFKFDYTFHLPDGKTRFVKWTAYYITKNSGYPAEY